MFGTVFFSKESEEKEANTWTWGLFTKSASFAAAASSELPCIISMHGLPHPFSTTIKGTGEEFSLEPSEVPVIASTSRPPASAALRRTSQYCWIVESASSLWFTTIIHGIVQGQILQKRVRWEVCKSSSMWTNLCSLSSNARKLHSRGHHLVLEGSSQPKQSA